MGAAVDAITTASRPLLIAGPEVARRNLTDLVEGIATSSCIPIVDPPWRDAEWATARSDHPHYCGVYRRDDPVMQSSDLVVIVGAPPLLESELRSDSGLPREATVIRIVDHPSWLDPLEERQIGVVGDIRATLEHIHRAPTEAHRGGSVRKSHVTELRQRWEARSSLVEPPVEATTSTRGVPIQTALRIVAEHLDENSTAVLDPVTATSALLDLLPRRTSSLFATGSGALGWGMGAAVGVALAQPDRRVAGIVGDGVFQFGVQAIGTAVRLKLPLTWIVLNNNGYHAVRNAVAKGKGARSAQPHPLADITDVDYVAIAQGFGADGVVVGTTDALRRTLSRPTPTDVPTVIDLRLHGQTTNPPGS
ncbi:thiamine pyrophosphate-dependent enzyme [Pseudonocardia nigra]|uniref:thiamine pyrophosphate-dependent enzyme n=1 Tax=Pseudonocardia nigra TaxID=1921578 RepID=UPI001C5CCF1E|nr:thiamine pyrophosphate-dependent enzyme [Pseudonocardia nigra]